MKNLIYVTAVATLIATPALSADMAVKAPPLVARAMNWTGCYVGAEGGGAWGSMSAVGANPTSIPATVGEPFANAHMSGVLIGGTVGCNYQTGNFVFGLENDLSWRRYNVQSANIPTFLGFTQTSATWLDTLRGRVGYATDRWLWYVTGGAAFSDMKIFEAAPGFTPVTSEISHELTGWTVGAGVEWAFPDPRWSVKAEYLYIDYGTHNYDFFDASAFTFAAINVRLTENIARVGLNYRFGGL